MHGKILSGGREITSNRPRGRQTEKIPKGKIPYGPEDLDGSGAVDFSDLLEILSSFGACP